MHKEKSTTVFVLFAAILFSTGGLLVKIIPWQPLAINGVRSVIAVIILGIYAKLTHHRIIFNRFVLLGGIATAATSFLYILAIKMTTAANAVLLQYTMPIFIIFYMLVFMKTRPRKTEVMACLFILVGMCLFFAEKLSFQGMLGNLLAILSGAALAVVYMTNVMPGSDALSAVICGHFLGMLVSLPFVFFERDFSLPVIASLSCIGVFQLGLAYVCLVRGLSNVSPVKASLISTIEPVLNPILVAVFYGETMGLTAILGAVVVLGGVIVYNLCTGKNKN